MWLGKLGEFKESLLQLLQADAHRAKKGGRTSKALFK